MSPATETAIYRIVQDGLTNVARHSEAATASVMIDLRQSAVRIIIEDDGQGFDLEAVQASGHHLGLQGIRERAALFAGHLVVEAQPDQGTSLFIEMTLKEHDTHA